MKLAFCLFKYFSYGGMEQNLIRILKECQQRNHSVDIYAMEWRGEKPKNVRLFLVPYSGWTNHTQCLSFVKNLQPILASQHYEAIIGFNRMPGLDIYYAADVCFEQNSRSRHSFLYRYLPRYKVFSSLERSVFNPNSKTQILLISEKEKIYFKRYYGTQDDRFHLLPPGISRNYQPPSNTKELRKEIREKMKIADNEYLVLFVGSNFYRKGLDRLLLAVSHLPNEIKHKTKIVVVGKGRQWFYRFLAFCLTLNAQVSFLGLCQDVPQLMLAGDLLVHPARTEAAGMIIVEAIISGLPSLVSSECGFAFHVQKAKAGIVLSEPFRQKELNSVLLTLLMMDENQKNKWRQNGLQYGRTEDLYSRAEQVVDFIENKVL